MSGEQPPIQNPHYPNPAGLSPGEIAAINATKGGDDDHPSYTDRQSARPWRPASINAIASRPEFGTRAPSSSPTTNGRVLRPRAAAHPVLRAGQLPLARGIRVPMIVISPYARAHAVSQAEGDHNAVIETIEAIFDLPPLASLPDEAQALSRRGPRFNGPDGFVQHHLGPRDINIAGNR